MYYLRKQKANDLSPLAQPGDKVFFLSIVERPKYTTEDLAVLLQESSTMTKGDAVLLIEALLFVCEQELRRGAIIEFLNIGSIRAVVGAPGVFQESDFDTKDFTMPHARFAIYKKFKEGVLPFCRFALLPEVTPSEP